MTLDQLFHRREIAHARMAKIQTKRWWWASVRAWRLILKIQLRMERDHEEWKRPFALTKGPAKR